jgi:4-amino-4-deoxy-L-arabinose transferase-like glycosyltransferase
MDAAGLYSYVAAGDGRPPWLPVDERRYRQRMSRAPSQSADGGGYLISTSKHAPPYYALMLPGYASARDTFSRLTAMRLVSALLGALTAVCAFLTLRELFPRREWLAVAAGLLVAFQPMFGFVSGSLNNDTGVNAGAALLIFLVVRGLRRGISLPLGATIGLLVVLLPLLKGRSYALYPAVGLALIGMIWRWHSRRDLPAYGAIAALAGAARATWSAIADSFGRTTFPTEGGVGLTAGDGPASGLQEPSTYLSYLWQVFLPRLPFMNELQLRPWPAFDIYVERGWAAFGWYAVTFPTWIYIAIAVAMTVAGALCALALWRERIAARARGWELAVLVLAVVGLIAGVEAHYAADHVRQVLPEQGRYAFVVIVPLATIALGACFAFGRRRAPLIATGLVATVMGLSYASYWLALSGFFA